MSAKYDRLNKLSEDEFRSEVLIPLLRRMEYERVRERHGPQEYGKDITYCQTSALNSTYYAVVAKVGDISGAASKKDSILVGTIKDQISQAFTIPIQDVTDQRGPDIFVNQVIVWTTGRISTNAETRIKQDIKIEHRSNVFFIDGEMTLEYLEQYYPAFFTIGDASISCYFETAKRTYCRLEELHNIGGSNAEKQLPVIFVAPTLTYLERVRSKQAKQEKLPYKKYTFAKLLQHQGNIFILGEMGSGKSALLRRILINVIEENERELRHYPIPILIRFKNLELKARNPLLDAIVHEYTRLGECPAPTDIETDLEDSKFMILLDGLDELETSTDIDHAITIVAEFVRLHRNTKVVVASRMLEALRTSNFLSNFSVFRIEDFSDAQMKELITKWFSTDQQNAKQLIKLISEPMTAATIPRTPLTLALIAILYQSGFNELPANLTELFQKYTELALGRWDMGKDLSSQVDWKKKQLVMRKISWDMLNHLWPDISTLGIEERIGALSSERGLSIDNNLVFREIVERSGLLVKNLEGNYEFKHRAFMDYFASGELNAQSNSVDIVVEQFPNPLWSRVIFFACGQKPEGEGENYLQAIMERVERNDCSALHYALQIGMLAQATYLAHQDSKIAAVQSALVSFTDAWDELVIGLRDAHKEGRIRTRPPQFFVLLLFSAFVQFSIGSATLSGALSRLVKEYLETARTSKVDDTVAKKNEWIAFELAIGCARAYNVNDFLVLLESNIINDPGLLQMSLFEAELLLEEESLESSVKEHLQNLVKQLKKTLKSSGDYMEKLFRQSPILLSPSNDLGETQLPKA